MAFVATNAPSGIRTDGPFAIDGLRCQAMTWTAISGDTSGTATANKLIEIQFVYVNGLKQTAAPTYSGNTVTLTFADPVASVNGSIMVIGV